MKKYGSMTDGVQTYKTVEIGDQTWMAENLNYAAEGVSYCYSKSTSNCTTYGKLYDWYTAITVCPVGWHLPSDSEWITLASFVGTNAGTKLKKAYAWNSYSGVASGTDNYGFAALPGGYGSWQLSWRDDLFQSLGEIGRWWSSSEYDGFDTDYTDYAYAVEMYYRNEGAGVTYLPKSTYYSVRCVED